ncbi:nitrilase-related carbon-nitrogen hydrolase [Gulosibacter sp. ACHW.36C]|uniref:CN hydrolase domain-containing protein n=1 Tax=Gulosibacter sediminis TaxID=1729695 RepID=A0ABY4MW51_9MICO|nr:nitrilase-related carbon-nitrogen hydrolase [Gulosibacter sediminis]UQN14660.1 hypothetical protein M3M28_11550 [Gulosibacter sediminis]
MNQRTLTAAAIQLGPIPLSAPRNEVLDRLVALLHTAADAGATFVVYPELALTSFFPHWRIDDRNELLQFYETDFPHGSVAPIMRAAAQRAVTFEIGYAEVTPEGQLFNTASLVDGTGELARYRKVHLPGFADEQPEAQHQLLEKGYFGVGNLGFPVTEVQRARVGMAICNDRRWPETYRLLALQGAEIACIGYNTPVATPHLPEIDRLTHFQNHLSMQAGAYQNSMWVIGAAKAGVEEGVDQIGGSAIIAPSGEIVAQAHSVEDEVVVAEIDLDMCTRYRAEVFNFLHHRRPELYGPISAAMDPAWPYPMAR